MPVAGHVPGGPGQMPPVGPGAKATATQFGGLSGGKKRQDGLVPGSPEALEANRKKDRLRKKAERAADPPPLPSATQTMAGTPSTASGGLGTLPGPEVQPVVPWDASAVQPIVEQFLPAAEELMVKQITDRAVRSRRTPEIVKAIEADAKWYEPAKKALNQNAAAVTAKWLNKLGVSSEYQAELALMTALSRIFGGHMLILRRLDKLIAVANVEPAKKVEGATREVPAAKP